MRRIEASIAQAHSLISIRMRGRPLCFLLVTVPHFRGQIKLIGVLERDRFKWGHPEA
jgi:hypothetical protein